MTISYDWPRRQRLFHQQHTHLFTRCVHALKLDVRYGSEGPSTRVFEVESNIQSQKKISKFGIQNELTGTEKHNPCFENLNPVSRGIYMYSSTRQ